MVGSWTLEESMSLLFSMENGKKKGRRRNCQLLIMKPDENTN